MTFSRLKLFKAASMQYLRRPACFTLFAKLYSVKFNGRYLEIQLPPECIPNIFYGVKIYLVSVDEAKVFLHDPLVNIRHPDKPVQR